MIKVVIYNDDEKQIGYFLIPDDVSKEWIERNVPPIVRAAQLFAGKIKETGY